MMSEYGTGIRRLFLFVLICVCFSRLDAVGMGNENPKNTPNAILSAQAIIKNKCVQCHGTDLKMGSLSLESRDELLKGGESGPAAVVGNSEQSLIVTLVSGQDEKRYMPMAGDKLTPEEIQTLRDWIDGGLRWEGENSQPGAKTPRSLELRNPSLPKPPQNEKNANPIDLLLQSYNQEHSIPSDRSLDDTGFIRRIYLDVIGLLPEPEVVQSFIANREPTKRERLIDELLGKNRDYAEHWMSVWNDWLRNAYRGTGFIDGGRKQITEWLYRSLRDNKPYDRFVSELIDPVTGTEGFSKGIIWRGVVNASQRPELQVAQNISQVFLGINLKCASCHDSFINQWKLKDAYGLASVFAEKPLEIVRCDKPTGETAEVKFLYPELGTISSDASLDVRREQLAEILTSKQNGRFARTIVNRLWAYFFGRGLIEPLDDMDAEAWNADLLEWLSYDLANHGFDLKRTIRWIVTSKAYQRPARDQAPNGKEYIFQGPLFRRFSAEQFVDALSRITGTPLSIPADFFDLDGREQGGQGKGTVLCENNHLMLFSSGKIRSGTTPISIPIQVPLSGVSRIHFVCADSLEAATPVLVLWSNPSFSFQDRSIPLQTLRGMRSFSGDGLVPSLRQSPNGEIGISMESQSILSLPVPPECSEFSCTVILPESGSDEENQHSYEIFLLAEEAGIRTVHLNDDPLQTALGRSNREQVVTRRDPTATTLQALELSNGRTLYRLIEQSIRNYLEQQSLEKQDLKDRILISQLFWKTLCRDPNEEELSISEELLRQVDRQEGYEDLLWSLVMLPEFQLIR